MCFTKAYVVAAVMHAPIKRAVGRRSFERGMDGLRDEVMGSLSSAFWNSMSSDVVSDPSHFSL
jgi:hypothetical protein